MIYRSVFESEVAEREFESTLKVCETDIDEHEHLYVDAEMSASEPGVEPKEPFLLAAMPKNDLAFYRFA